MKGVPSVIFVWPDGRSRFCFRSSCRNQLCDWIWSKSETKRDKEGSDTATRHTSANKNCFITMKGVPSVIFVWPHGRSRFRFRIQLSKPFFYSKSEWKKGRRVAISQPATHLQIKTLLLLWKEAPSVIFVWPDGRSRFCFRIELSKNGYIDQNRSDFGGLPARWSEESNPQCVFFVKRLCLSVLSGNKAALKLLTVGHSRARTSGLDRAFRMPQRRRTGNCLFSRPFSRSLSTVSCHLRT